MYLKRTWRETAQGLVRVVERWDDRMQELDRMIAAGDGELRASLQRRRPQGGQRARHGELRRAKLDRIAAKMRKKYGRKQGVAR